MPFYIRNLKFVIQWFLNQSHIRNNWKPFKNCLLNLRWVPEFGNFSKSSIVVVQWLSHIQLFATPWTAACQASLSLSSVQFSSVLTYVWLFVTPWTAARQASLSVTNSQILLKLMSIKSVMPSNYLILCCPLLLLPSIFPSIRVFSNESVLRIRWPDYWSFSFCISPDFLQDWFPFGWTSWISLQSKGLSRVFSNTTV